jgi:phage-related protein (TIGR01555 family)
MAEVTQMPAPSFIGRRRLRAGTNPPQEQLAAMASRDSAAHALDYFSNVPARMGYGTPSLAEAATYELDRLSFSYWLLITLYENHWISAKIVDTPAQDMIKAWPRLTSDINPKELTKLDKVIRKTQTKAQMKMAMKWGRLFGGAGALIVIDGDEDRLDKPIDLEAIEIGSYRGLIPFDRWTGIYPEGEICTDINRPIDFNRPENYRVNVGQGGESFSIHSSRVLRFTGPEMPTPEREAHSWWGISEITRAYEEIRKRDNMSWNILSLTFRAQILGMKFPELAKQFSGVGSSQKATMDWQARMAEINRLVSNQSMLALPENGGLESVNYTFSGLSECYQQFQLDISGATGIPVTRLFGRTITGLGQANDADERIYEERIASDQDTHMRPQLEKLYPVLCMSELGEVPDDLDLAFPSIRVLDEKEKAELAKTSTDTVLVAVNSSLISKRTAAKELKQMSDITGIFTNITDEDIEKLPDDIEEMGEGMGEGGEGGMGGLFGPQRVEKKSEEEVARASDDEFREGEHPRDEEGKFADKGGSKAAGLKEYKDREEWPEHVKALKIPPAWKEVKVSDNPNADLLAVGRDAKGRPQYVYSAKFKNSQSDVKFQRVSQLSKDLPVIDKQLSSLQKSPDPKTRDHADCMMLIRKMGIRPGSDSDTKAKVKAYGATTLQGHHVWQMGNTTRLRFVGKKGVTISLPVEDGKLASMLRDRRAKSGDSGKLFPNVSDSSLLDFSHEKLDHGHYKTKDFRTHLANDIAGDMVGKLKPPANEKEYKKRVKEVATAVAEKLGNTPTVALQSYIAPQVFAGWRQAYGNA